MPPKPLYRSLDENLAFLEEMFGRSDDFYTKRLLSSCLQGFPPRKSFAAWRWTCWTVTLP